MKDNGLLVSVLVLAWLYTISRGDVIPDVIPVVGWADDVVVGVGAGDLPP